MEEEPVALPMVNQKILKNQVQGMIKEVELASCIIKSSEVQSFPVVSPFLYIFIVFHRIKIFLVTHAPTITPNFATTSGHQDGRRCFSSSWSLPYARIAGRICNKDEVILQCTVLTVSNYLICYGLWLMCPKFIARRS